MENQHRQVAGYRELNQYEIDAMNEVKAYGVVLEKFLVTVRALPHVDQRWVAIANTDLQTGLMALTRAIARPTTF